MIILFIKYKIIMENVIWTNKNELDCFNYISERIFYQIFLLLHCSPVNSHVSDSTNGS